MRVLRGLAFFAFALLCAAPVLAQGASDVPRNETLIVENPEGTIKNAGWFNIWATNAGGQSTGLHQLTMDTFWYIDPDHGLDGVWDNSLASEPPIYNADFTEMASRFGQGRETRAVNSIIIRYQYSHKRFEVNSQKSAGI